MKKKMVKKTKGIGYIPFISGIGICKNSVKGLGLFFFIIGAVLIMTAFFGASFTGNVVFEGGLKNVASVAGILLEIIGIALMVIKVKEKPITSKTSYRQL